MEIQQLTQLTDKMLSLPSEARALLAERLLESLDSAEERNVRRLWIEEIKKRVSDIRSGRVKLLSGNEALNYLHNG